MAGMTLTEIVKLNLRVDTNAFDVGEIDILIAAAKNDLYHAGVKKAKTQDETDVIIQRGIVLFCKANFGTDADTQAKWAKAYEAYKTSLAVSGDYGGGAQDPSAAESNSGGESDGQS